MTKKKIVKIELTNPRFSKTEIMGHASEFILYARYSGFILENLNEHLREAKLVPIKSDFNESSKIHLETTIDNAKMLYQLTKMYPSFGNWKIRPLSKGIDITTFAFKPQKVKKKKTKKAPAKKAAPPKKKAPVSNKKRK